MRKVAYRAVLCYNLARNIVVSEGASNTTLTLINLLRRLIVNTLPPHTQDDNTPLKHCSGPCGRILPATPEYFHRMARARDGFKNQCKACLKEKQQAHQKLPEVREQRRAYKKAYYRTPGGHERTLAQNKTRYYRPEIHEQILAQQAIYRCRSEVQTRQSAYNKVYCRRPEVKLKHNVRNRIRRSLSEVQQQERIYRHAYRKRPDVQERDHVYRRAYNTLPEKQAHKKAWTQAYQSLPETKERSRAYQHNRRARVKSIPGTYTVAQIQEQLKRQRYRCYYAACGHVRFEKRNGEYVYHIDHTFPISRIAGTDIPGNDMSYLVLACPTCNLSKGDKFPWEWPEGGKLL